MSTVFAYFDKVFRIVVDWLMFVSLIQTIRKANKKDDDGLVSTAPTFKFLCAIQILKLKYLTM